MKLKIFIVILLLFCNSYHIFSQTIDELNRKTLKQDMTYYRRMCKLKKDLTVNDKLYMLYRIRDKYAGTSVNISTVKKEIKKLEPSRDKKQVKPSLKKKTIKPKPKKIEKPKLTKIEKVRLEKFREIISSLDGKTFDDDMVYYYDVCEKENFPSIDRLFLLYKIRDKYQGEDIDTIILMDEIFTLEEEVAKRLGASLEGETIDEDMFFYYRVSGEKGLNVNDKLFILYKIRDKYQGQDVDMTVLQEEIKTTEAQWSKEPKPSAPPPSYVTGFSTETIARILQSTAPAKRRKTSGKIELIEQPEYIIRSGDVLGIRIYPNNELSSEVIVRPDGTFKLPLLGTVIAGGLGIVELQRFLQKSLSRYIISPEVSVNIRHSSEDEMLLTGEVYNPGIYSYEKNLRLLELIAISGGFTTSADTKHIKIHRGKRGERKIILVNAEEIVESGDLSKDVPLEKGDIIEIQKTLKKISIIGAVVSPGSYDYSKGMKTLDAVSLAGGPIKSAKLSVVKIFRETEEGKETHTVRLDLIIRGNTEYDKELKPADIVYVPYKKLPW